MRTHALAAAAVLTLALTGCTAASPTESPEPTPKPTVARADVNWDALPSDYQRIVDEETTARDCDALQDMFDAAPDNPTLLTYLDEALELAGCY